MSQRCLGRRPEEGEALMNGPDEARSHRVRMKEGRRRNGRVEVGAGGGGGRERERGRGGREVGGRQGGKESKRETHDLRDLTSHSLTTHLRCWLQEVIITTVPLY